MGIWLATVRTLPMNTLFVQSVLCRQAVGAAGEAGGHILVLGRRRSPRRTR